METNKQLIQSLGQAGVLESKKIREALLKFSREQFVPQELVAHAYEDAPLPIGQGQTISQPFTVLFMLKLLDVKQGDNILEIGAGSGWQTALLSHLAGKEGRVWAYEINETVGEFGKQNLAKFKLSNVDYIIDDAVCHWERHAPYERIIGGAAFGKIPHELKKLLSIGGRLVAPTQAQDVRLITRKNNSQFDEDVFYGFVFVPITH
jgi:protein-L-isoaspartate(D-aspartate) O-methyltransferase